jgi:hypothetical protein
MRGREHESGSADVELGNLWRERPRVVDDMMSPKPFNPLLGFRPRGGGDDDEIRALSSDLDGDRPDPTRTTDDEDRRRPGTGFVTSRRSNMASQAVNVVSGSAAASAQSSDAGLRPTIRASTRWNSALVPGLMSDPA